jgi:hypothetical protein
MEKKFNQVTKTSQNPVMTAINREEAKNHMNWCDAIGKEQCKSFIDCDHCYAYGKPLIPSSKDKEKYPNE